MRKTHTIGRARTTITVLASATVLALGVAGPVAAAAPAAAPADTSSSGDAVTMDSDGWIHYNDTEAGSLQLTDPTTVTVTGTADSDGCTFDETGDVAAGAEGAYVEQLAVNPTTCQEQVVQGTLTSSAQSALDAQSSTDIGSVDGDAPDQSTDGQDAPALDGNGNPILPGPIHDVTPNTVRPDSAVTTHAYEKTSYIDPVGLTITSLSFNLGWTHNNGVLSSASYKIVPYKFAYDGWSTSGTPHPGFGWGSGDRSVGISGHEQFKNNDFEELLLAVSAPIPGGPAAVFAACGFSVATAVFNHTESIRGNGDGGYTWSYSDKTSGGCSDLVHHKHYTNFGSKN